MNKQYVIKSLSIIIIDQIIKYLIMFLLSLNESITIIPNFFNITYVINKGAAWNILNDKTWLLIIITILLLLFIYYIEKDFKKNKRNEWAFSLVYGGIIGNLIDRLFKSGVVDFLDFKIFGYDYPVFNIADIAIVIGIILIIISIFKGEDNGSKSRSK